MHSIATDRIDEELLSAASVSLYGYITKTVPHSGKRTDSKQENGLKMNRS